MKIVLFTIRYSKINKYIKFIHCLYYFWVKIVEKYTYCVYNKTSTK